METILQRLTDTNRLMLWRKEVLRSVFGATPSDDLLEANSAYFESHIADGSHVAFVAIRDGEEMGCGAVCFQDEMPSPENPYGKCAYIMNMYVRPTFRHMGIARVILKRLIQEANARGCGKIYLETTDMARHTYAKMGFRDMKNMMIYEI